MILVSQKNLEAEELKLLNHDVSSAAKSWVSRQLDSLASSMIAKIASKFHLVVSK